MSSTSSELSLIEPVARAWRATSGPIVVVTGAGISAPSGLRTFRGREPGAIWRESDVSMATVAHFHRDPVDQMSWYFERFAAVDSALPNAGHIALVELERLSPGTFALVTQNIDTLHERAGSRRLIKVHGTADRLRCGSSGCPLGEPAGSIDRSRVEIHQFIEAPGEATLPRCPQCGYPLRAHVLFFDEYYTSHVDYRFPEVERLLAEAELLLFVGTSFSVGVTTLALQAGQARGVPMYSIDPVKRPTGSLPVAPIVGGAETLLPLLVGELAV